MNYIWRKQVQPYWLLKYREVFESRFGQALVLIEQPGKTRVSLEIVCGTKRKAQELNREFGGRIELIHRNWVRKFIKQDHKLIRIGARLQIVRERQETTVQSQSKHARTIVIPADAAFGTGEHTTTAMCLRLLEKITRGVQPGWTMFDAGTGSGILAIAGTVFGAAHVIAIDNDPLAWSTAKRNAGINRISNIQFSVKDLLRYKPRKKFDFITANLFSEVLIDAFPLWSAHLSPNGHFILSGILREQELAIVRALLEHGFIQRDILRRGKWVAVHSQRPNAKRRLTP